MLRAIRRILLVTLLVLGSAFLLYQGFLFWRAMDKLPPGTTIAGVDVAGLTLDAAREAVNERFLSPVAIFNGQERAAELLPAEVGFTIDTEAAFARLSPCPDPPAADRVHRLRGQLAPAGHDGHKVAIRFFNAVLEDGPLLGRHRLAVAIEAGVLAPRQSDAVDRQLVVEAGRADLGRDDADGAGRRAGLAHDVAGRRGNVVAARRGDVAHVDDDRLVGREQFKLAACLL